MTGESSDIEELKDLQREVAELRAEREKSRATAKRASSAKKTGAEKSDTQKPGTQKQSTKQKGSVKKKSAAQASADEEQAAEQMNEQATEQATEQADEQTLDAEKKVQEIADQFESVVNQLEEAARERPALAMLAAFTTGVVVGYILTRKS